MHKKNNRGFTLVEVSVALAVGAIILVMLSIVLVNINNVFNNKNYAMDKFNEFEDIKMQIVKICDDCSSNAYLMQVNEDGKSLNFQNGLNDIKLLFSENKLLKNGEKVIEFKTISSCEFEIIQNVLMVNVNFTNDTKLRFAI